MSTREEIEREVAELMEAIDSSDEAASKRAAVRLIGRLLHTLERVADAAERSSTSPRRP